MDFHTMKRKDLQELCKKHNIRANLTNLEMANRLASLLKKKMDDEKPQEQRMKPCLKSPEDLSGVDERNSDGKEAKKVRFNPQNETFEFEKTNPRAVRMATRGRKSMVIVEDKINKEARVSETEDPGTSQQKAIENASADNQGRNTRTSGRRRKVEQVEVVEAELLPMKKEEENCGSKRPSRKRTGGVVNLEVQPKETKNVEKPVTRRSARHVDRPDDSSSLTEQAEVVTLPKRQARSVCPANQDVEKPVTRRSASNADRSDSSSLTEQVEVVKLPKRQVRSVFLANQDVEKASTRGLRRNTVKLASEKVVEDPKTRVTRNKHASLLTEDKEIVKSPKRKATTDCAVNQDVVKASTRCFRRNTTNLASEKVIEDSKEQNTEKPRTTRNIRQKKGDIGLNETILATENVSVVEMGQQRRSTRNAISRSSIAPGAVNKQGKNQPMHKKTPTNQSEVMNAGEGAGSCGVKGESKELVLEEVESTNETSTKEDVSTQKPENEDVSTQKPENEAFSNEEIFIENSSSDGETIKGLNEDEEEYKEVQNEGSSEDPKIVLLPSSGFQSLSLRVTSTESRGLTEHSNLEPENSVLKVDSRVQCDIPLPRTSTDQFLEISLPACEADVQGILQTQLETSSPNSLIVGCETNNAEWEDHSVSAKIILSNQEVQLNLTREDEGIIQDFGNASRQSFRDEDVADAKAYQTLSEIQSPLHKPVEGLEMSTMVSNESVDPHADKCIGNLGTHESGKMVGDTKDTEKVIPTEMVIEKSDVLDICVSRSDDPSGECERNHNQELVEKSDSQLSIDEETTGIIAESESVLINNKLEERNVTEVSDAQQNDNYEDAVLADKYLEVPEEKAVNNFFSESVLINNELEGRNLSEVSDAQQNDNYEDAVLADENLEVPEEKGNNAGYIQESEEVTPAMVDEGSEKTPISVRSDDIACESSHKKGLTEASLPPFTTHEGLNDIASLFPLEYVEDEIDVICNELERRNRAEVSDTLLNDNHDDAVLTQNLEDHEELEECGREIHVASGTLDDEAVCMEGATLTGLHVGSTAYDLASSDTDGSCSIKVQIASPSPYKVESVSDIKKLGDLTFTGYRDKVTPQQSALTLNHVVDKADESNHRNLTAMCTGSTEVKMLHLQQVVPEPISMDSCGHMDPTESDAWISFQDEAKEQKDAITPYFRLLFPCQTEPAVTSITIVQEVSGKVGTSEATQDEFTSNSYSPEPQPADVSLPMDWEEGKSDTKNKAAPNVLEGSKGSMGEAHISDNNEECEEGCTGLVVPERIPEETELKSSGENFSLTPEPELPSTAVEEADGKNHSFTSKPKGSHDNEYIENQTDNRDVLPCSGELKESPSKVEEGLTPMTEVKKRLDDGADGSASGRLAGSAGSEGSHKQGLTKEINLLLNGHEENTQRPVLVQEKSESRDFEFSSYEIALFNDGDHFEDKAGMHDYATSWENLPTSNMDDCTNQVAVNEDQGCNLSQLTLFNSLVCDKDDCTNQKDGAPTNDFPEPSQTKHEISCHPEHFKEFEVVHQLVEEDGGGGNRGIESPVTAFPEFRPIIPEDGDKNAAVKGISSKGLFEGSKELCDSSSLVEVNPTAEGLICPIDEVDPKMHIGTEADTNIHGISKENLFEGFTEEGDSSLVVEANPTAVDLECPIEEMDPTTHICSEEDANIHGICNENLFEGSMEECDSSSVVEANPAAEDLECPIKEVDLTTRICAEADAYIHENRENKNSMLARQETDDDTFRTEAVELDHITPETGFRTTRQDSKDMEEDINIDQVDAVPGEADENFWLHMDCEEYGSNAKNMAAPIGVQGSEEKLVIQSSVEEPTLIAENGKCDENRAAAEPIALSLEARHPVEVLYSAEHTKSKEKFSAAEKCESRDNELTSYEIVLFTGNGHNGDEAGTADYQTAETNFLTSNMNGSKNQEEQDCDSSEFTPLNTVVCDKDVSVHQNDILEPYEAKHEYLDHPEHYKAFEEVTEKIDPVLEDNSDSTDQDVLVDLNKEDEEPPYSLNEFFSAAETSEGCNEKIEVLVTASVSEMKSVIQGDEYENADDKGISNEDVFQGSKEEILINSVVEANPTDESNMDSSEANPLSEEDVEEMESTKDTRIEQDVDMIENRENNEFEPVGQETDDDTLGLEAVDLNHTASEAGSLTTEQDDTDMEEVMMNIEHVADEQNKQDCDGFNELNSPVSKFEEEASQAEHEDVSKVELKDASHLEHSRTYEPLEDENASIDQFTSDMRGISKADDEITPELENASFDKVENSSRLPKSVMNLKKRSILIHGTPRRPIKTIDMKENSVVGKRENLGDATAFRPLAQRKALGELHKR